MALALSLTFPSQVTATRGAPAASGQPANIEHGPPQAPGVFDCDAVGNATMRIAALTHVPWADFTLNAQAEVEITTAHLAPAWNDVELPVPSPICDGTAWHQTSGACVRDADCLSQTCDLAEGRCSCAASAECCSGECTAGVCAVATLTATSDQHDTALILLRCGDALCTYGEVIAADDNGRTTTDDPRDARIAVAALPAGTYRVLTYSAAPGAAVRAVLAVVVNGQVVHELDHVIGGSYGTDRELRPADAVFVGKDNDGRGMPFVPGQPIPAHHDTRLWLFERSFDLPCEATQALGCGRFVFNDDAFAAADRPLRLSRAAVPADWTALHGSALFGAAAAGVPATWINARVLHHRRHTSEGGAWQGACHLDRDQDGLTAEIEWELGTCDDVSSEVPLGVGIAGRTCVQYKDFVESFTPGCPMPGGGSHPDCWSPRDSDNDGLEDGWEVFGVAFSCTHPPAGPMGRVGSCSPLSIHDGSCPAGKHCLTEALSARDDPHPTVYDIYLQYVAARCGPAGVTAKDVTCRGDHPTLTTLNDGDEHSVSFAQRLRLARTFTIDAATCADGGSALAAGNSTCAGDAHGDLRYFVSLHVMPLDDHDLSDNVEPGVHQTPDDTWQAEIIGGNNVTSALWNDRFAGAMRHGGLARLAYLDHLGSGIAPIPGNSMVVSNEGQDPRAPATAIAHELGHTLGLLHPFDLSSDAQPWSVSTTTCTTMTPLCVTPGDAMTDARDAPQVDSLMSYGFFGMRPRGVDAPAAGTAAYAGCGDWTNDHFSKGYNMPIGETGVTESAPLDPVAAFRQRSLVNTLACYVPLNGVNVGTCADPVNRNQAYGFPPGTGSPFCTATHCHVNWDGNGVVPLGEASYLWEVNFASNGAPHACGQDILTDRNDFGIMMGVGKQPLQERRLVGADMLEPGLYAATFNRGNAVNLMGWSASHLPVSVNGTYAVMNYPVNSCQGDADCPSVGAPAVAKCLNDNCSSDADCLTSCNVALGRCACAGPADCLSQVCDGATSMCAQAGLAACRCGADADCQPAGNPALGGTMVTCQGPPQPGPVRACVTRAHSGAAGSNSGEEFPYREVLLLNPAGTNELRLSRDGASTTNALALVGGFLAASVTLRFDFQWGGFLPGQSIATVFQSSLIRFDYERDTSGQPVAKLTPVSMDTGTGSPTPMDPMEVGASNFTWQAGVWYRVGIIIDRRIPNATFIRFTVWRWHPGRGRFEAAVCFQRTLPTYEMAVVSDMIFAWDGSAAATRTPLALDNVTLAANVDYTGFDVATCVEVLP